jgi:hypothetical protein
MYTINNDNIVESLEKMANDIQYPPLNGGPTKDDILAMLRGASAVIAELESDIDDQDEAADRAEELESAVTEASDKLDDIVINLTLAQASGELGESKALEAIQDAIMEVRSNLRRA